MKKLFFFLTTCFILLTSCYSHASAHVGGGPPFLVVDGVYAVTNPYFFNDPAINIPQDYTGKTYLVNKAINLFVDTDKLLVPPDIAAGSDYRWTFAENSNNYEFGKTIQHTYTKPGSYIISLEVKAPGETEYILIDTVQLDILPNENYKLPTATMAVETDHLQSKKPILFTSKYSHDPSAKIVDTIWGFGDGTTSRQPQVLHTYTNMQDYSTFPVVYRVTDNNGFKEYAGIIVEASKNTLHFIDNTGKENTIPVSDMITHNGSGSKQTDTNKQNFALPVVIGGIIVVIVLLVGWLVMKKRKE